ncbi:MAG: sigma-70 family RNA polymerase sigma factor [Deltaproteobacteria bacterium]|nr:MAG: sigma-70 family RNA polymerase sigma factor [Deltaproteobacteria bacterium]
MVQTPRRPQERPVTDTTTDDRILVARAQQGERGAFEALFRRHQRRVFAVALGIVRNEEDALDIVQEAFIKAYRSLPRFKGESSFFTWLYRITTNLCIDHGRRNKKHRASSFEEQRTRIDEDGPAAERGAAGLRRVTSPDEAVARKEIRDAFRAALDELPEIHRSVIVLRELQGMSYAEMADALGVPKGTIMSRLHHARRKLREALEARGIVLGAGDGGSESTEGATTSKEAVVP